MSKSSETQAVEATIIEEGELAALTKAEEWLAQVNERAELLAEQYKPHDITGEADYKASVKARADANKKITAINQERKNMTEAIEKAVQDFKDGAKIAIAPLTRIVEAYDEKNGEYKTRWVNERLDAVRTAYEEFAPALALPQDGEDEALVPFDRLLAKYGNEKGTGWTLRGVPEPEAISAMQAAVQEIAKAEQTIDKMVEEEWRKSAKARYFRTLDLQATLNEEAEAKAQRERVAKMEAERAERAAEAERIAAERASMEEAERAKAEFEAVPDDWAPFEPEEPPADYVPAEAEPVRIAPAPAMVEVPLEPTLPKLEPTSQATGQVPAEPIQYEPPRIIPAPQDTPRAWVVKVPSATKAQMQQLANALTAMGLRGTISAAKEATNA